MTDGIVDEYSDKYLGKDTDKYKYKDLNEKKLHDILTESGVELLEENTSLDNLRPSRVRPSREVTAERIGILEFANLLTPNMLKDLHTLGDLDDYEPDGKDNSVIIGIDQSGAFGGMENTYSFGTYSDDYRAGILRANSQNPNLGHESVNLNTAARIASSLYDNIDSVRIENPCNGIIHYVRATTIIDESGKEVMHTHFILSERMADSINRLTSPSINSENVSQDAFIMQYNEVNGHLTPISAAEALQQMVDAAKTLNDAQVVASEDSVAEAELCLLEHPNSAYQNDIALEDAHAR